MSAVMCIPFALYSSYFSKRNCLYGRESPITSQRLFWKEVVHFNSPVTKVFAA